MKTIERDWGFFSPKFGLTFLVCQGDYFDSRYVLKFCFIWGYFFIYLPFRTKLEECCDTPRYGIDNHDSILWLYWGGDCDESTGQMESENLLTFDYPFYNFEFENHWVMNKNKEWQVVKPDEFSDDIYKWAEVIEEPYKYALNNGTVQERMAKCYKEKRQWHRKWLPFMKKVSTSLEVSFSDEVGERTGSWKGGVTGCGYEMKRGESMMECLRRMELNRKF